jgi:Cd2+/Zn2+-exporting ATPase/Cu+-exporting ATPase
MLKKIFQSPTREYVLAVAVLAGLALDYFGGYQNILLGIIAIGALMPLANGIYPLLKGKITIDSFNAFALTISFAAGEIYSSAFIILMLLFAYVLDWQLISRKNRAVEELLRLKPIKAFREVGEIIEEVHTEDIKTGDILIVREGLQIPADGVIIFGEATINEALVTGESVPVKKNIGDEVLGSTISLAGTIKIKATRIGKDSTLERIASLIQEASKHKSRSEKTADKFAKIFLPLILILGAVTYFITRNILLTASLFLVACADDMAVAIPLAMTAAIGKAAKWGVIIKGGEWIDVLSKVNTIVVDKTGTLTYGDLRIDKVVLKNNISEKEFWTLAGIADKLSHHPVGRAIYKEALSRVGDIPDPDSFSAIRGMGVSVIYHSQEIFTGNADILLNKEVSDAVVIIDEMKTLAEQENAAINAVVLDKKVIGYILVKDLPKAEAKESIARLKNIGVKRIAMFTGDAKNVADNVGHEMGITEVRSEMKPETKVTELEKLLNSKDTVAMVGDGINDTPALARADIGIGMGGAGTAVTIEAADVIILTDKLNLLPEIILLSRKTMSVIRGDMGLWVLSNVFGFALVFLGFLSPALAAFYNFATDFLPLINSARLFKSRRSSV